MNKDEGKSKKVGKTAAVATQLAELEQQIGMLTEALQHERADATNLRRRVDEERAHLATFYKALVVRDLLSFIDNFERALKHAPTEKSDQWSEWYKGLEGVHKQLQQSLDKLGVARIKTVGEVFDPRYHEAVVMEEGDGAREVVSEELQAGYILGDEVIRHAMVKVTTE